jgi:hypothetical protein
LIIIAPRASNDRTLVPARQCLCDVPSDGVPDIDHAVGSSSRNVTPVWEGAMINKTTGAFFLSFIFQSCISTGIQEFARVATCRNIRLKFREFSLPSLTWAYARPVPVDTILVRMVLHLQDRVVLSNVNDAHSVVARIRDDLRACIHKVKRTVDQGPGFNCRLQPTIWIGLHHRAEHEEPHGKLQHRILPSSLSKGL